MPELKKTLFNIVLVNPEIPQNTGNIGRLCVSTECALHLIKPVGFSLDDKYLKRAGLDYWPHLDLHVYENWQDFMGRQKPEKIYFLSTKGTKNHWDCPLEDSSYIVFGNESSGLPHAFYKKYLNELYTIPMSGEHFRSLNIANAVAVTIYEGLRRRHNNSLENTKP